MEITVDDLSDHVPVMESLDVVGDLGRILPAVREDNELAPLIPVREFLEEFFGKNLTDLRKTSPESPNRGVFLI